MKGTTMSNEEKAQEIADNHNLNYEIALNAGFTSSYTECKKSALDMAEWKDAQIKEELNIIIEWFNHIKQIANDKKTLNGFVMKDSDALDEIKCIAKDSIEYISTIKEEMK